MSAVRAVAAPAPRTLSSSDKALVEAMSAALGGLISTVVFYPLDTAKTRVQAAVEGSARKAGLQRKPSKSSLAVMAEIMCKGTAPNVAHVVLVFAFVGFELAHSPHENQGNKEGIPALYRGLGIKLAHTLGQTFLYFYIYAFLRRSYEKRVGGKLGTASNLVIGMLAGCCNVLITQPLDTASTRKQAAAAAASAPLTTAGRRAAIASAARRESAEERRQSSAAASSTAPSTADGAAAAPSPSVLSPPTPSHRDESGLGRLSELYRGLGASLLLTTNPAIQNTVFEQLRRRLLRTPMGDKAAESLSAAGAFVLGALAKSVATFTTYPMVRSKVMIQAAKHGSPESSYSMLSMLQHIVRADGIGGLFKGLGAQLLKTVLAAALMLAIKEKAYKAALSLMLAFRGGPPGLPAPAAKPRI